MDAGPLIAALPGDFTVTLVDVGSAGGLSDRWRPFAPILSSVLFDPRESQASGQLGRGRARTYPVALGDRAGPATMRHTAMANMSSFLDPDPAQFARFQRKGADALVVGTSEIAVERLDALAARDGFRPDLIKIDTQGSELMVLRGAEQALASVVLAEIEVSFFPRYRGQPLMAEIEQHMARRGFELIDLIKLKRYRSANSLGIRNAGVRRDDRSGRLAYADAVFLRREEELEKLGAQGLVGAIIGLTAYGKAGLAARLLDEGQGRLPAALATAIGNALSRLKPGLVRRLLGAAP